MQNMSAEVISDSQRVFVKHTSIEVVIACSNTGPRSYAVFESNHQPVKFANDRTCYIMYTELAYVFRILEFTRHRAAAGQYRRYIRREIKKLKRGVSVITSVSGSYSL